MSVMESNDDARDVVAVVPALEFVARRRAFKNSAASSERMYSRNNRTCVNAYTARARMGNARIKRVERHRQSAFVCAHRDRGELGASLLQRERQPQHHVVVVPSPCRRRRRTCSTEFK